MMIKGKVDNSEAELREVYARHNTAGIVDFLAKHKTEPQYSKLYARAVGPNRDLYGAVERYLSDKGNLQEKKKLTVPENSKARGDIREPLFINQIKNLKRDYESGHLSADQVYSQLRSLEEQFSKFSDYFYRLYGDLELLSTTKMESETRTRLKKSG